MSQFFGLLVLWSLSFPAPLDSSYEELQIGFYGLCVSCVCCLLYSKLQPSFCQMRGVFTMYDDTGIANEGACLRYHGLFKIYGEPESPNEGRV